MGDATAAAPLPVVFTDPGASRLETTLAAVAIEKAAHALDWALRGDAAHAAHRWVRVTRASVLAAPDANAIAMPDALDRLVIAPLATPATDPGATGAGERPWACVLATRLDVPAVLERELLDLLAVATHALIDRHGGFHDWIPRRGDPTVRVRIPAEHHGLPLAFCPFVATRRSALDALDDGPLFDEVLELVAGAFNDSQDVQRRTPQ